MRPLSNHGNLPACFIRRLAVTVLLKVLCTLVERLVVDSAPTARTL